MKFFCQCPCVSVGFDLGTSYSCVAVMRNNMWCVIPNDQGMRTTPSYVAFTDSERLIGQAAKNQAWMHPSNTIFAAKRLLGRSFSDRYVQQDLKLWPFTVVKGANSKPMIKVSHKGENKTFTAQDILTMLLIKMKKTACDYLGIAYDYPAFNGVISVPAYFNFRQREAIRETNS